MTAFSLQYPAIVQAREHARNGLYPDAQFYGELAGALNHTLAYRKKCVFTRANALGNLFTGDDPGTTWRWYFRTGYGTQKLALLGVTSAAYDWRASSPDNVNTADPRLTLTFVKVGTGALPDVVWHTGGSTQTPTDAPVELGSHYTEIDVDPASDYYAEVTSTNYARLISLTVHEIGLRTIDDSVNYYTEIEPVAGGAILDAHVQRLIQGPSRMLSQNGALQINWCLYNGAVRSRTNTAWINLLDNASVSPPTATSLGYRLNTTGRNTRSATTIPIMFAVYGNATGSGDGHVTLRDTSGTDVAVCDITGGGAAAWHTLAGTIPVGSGSKLDLGFYADAATTVNVYAVSIFEAG